MSTLLNCTPHVVRLVLPSGRTVDLPASLRPVRLIEPAPERSALAVGGEAVEVLATRGSARRAALPAARAGTYLLVSSVVAAACPERPDLLAPATGPGEGAVRDAEGRITAVTRLKRFLPNAASAGGSPSGRPAEIR